MNNDNKEKFKALLNWPEQIKKVFLYLLLALSFIVIAFSIYELAYTLVRDIFSEPRFHLEIYQLLGIFSYFLLVLIGLEVADSIRAYIFEGAIYVETVILIALTAVARKAFIIDTEKMSSSSIFAISTIITSLAVAYYLLKKAKQDKIP